MTVAPSQEVAAAVADQPDGFWPHFYHGVCAYRLGRNHEAVAAFRACLAPGAAPCHVNRALAWLELGEHESALADLECAIALAPAG